MEHYRICRIIMLFFLIFIISPLFSPAFAQVYRGIIVVSDSRDELISESANRLVEILDSYKAQEKFETYGITASIQRYDFAKKKDKEKCIALKIEQAELPLLAIAEITEWGRPKKILWKTQADDPDTAVEEMMQRIRSGFKSPPKKSSTPKEKKPGTKATPSPTPKTTTTPKKPVSPTSKPTTSQSKSTSTVEPSATSQRKIEVYGYKYLLRLLEFKDGEWKIIKEYPIGIGKNGMGKTKAGDAKTPIGDYKIIWKASRFSSTDGGYPIIEGKAFCGPNNQFTTDPNVGYSSESLWTAGYGGKEAVVMCLDYPNDSDKKKGFTGG